MLTTPDDEFDGAPYLGKLDSHVREDPSCYSVTLAYQPQENMLGADEIVVEALRFLLSKGYGFPRTLRKAIETPAHARFSARPRGMSGRRTGGSERRLSLRAHVISKQSPYAVVADKRAACSSHQ